MYPECYSTFQHWIFTNQDLRHEVKAGLKFNACWTFLQCSATSLAFLPGIWNALIRELINTNCFLKGTENVPSHTHTHCSQSVPDSGFWIHAQGVCFPFTVPRALHTETAECKCFAVLLPRAALQPYLIPGGLKTLMSQKRSKHRTFLTRLSCVMNTAQWSEV